MTNVTDFFKDFDTIIEAINRLQFKQPDPAPSEPADVSSEDTNTTDPALIVEEELDERYRVLAANKSSDATGSNTLSNVQIFTDDYNITLVCTHNYLTIQEAGYGLLNNITIDTRDVLGYDIGDHAFSLQLRSDNNRALPSVITLDFADLSRSTPALLNTERMEKFYRIIPHEVRFHAAQLIA